MRLHITFEYRDEFSGDKWQKQECVLSSVKECIELYGLNECEYHILNVERV